MSLQKQIVKLPLLALTGVTLLIGLWTGLMRLGWAAPTLAPGIHGGLMVGGVMGTLICLERAVAMTAVSPSYRWAYLAPVLTGSGGVLMVLGFTGIAPFLILYGSAVLVVIFSQIVRRQFAAYTVVMSLGAVCWLTGNALWASGSPIYQIVHLWIAFLVLTIVGERLELARIRRISERVQRLFALSVALFLCGVIWTVFDLNMGVRLAGIGEILLALWLLQYDIARYTVKKPGLPRFIAVCLLTGYGWLAVGGLIGLLSGAVYAGIVYEMLLHAILLGFVFSMIFGHAPIIIPAVIGRTVNFSPLWYGFVILLHSSLLLREVSGFMGWTMLHRYGGILNVLAILTFMGCMLWNLHMERNAR